MTASLKMATEAAARAFFSSPQFAVVGASSDPNKFGHKSPSLPSRLNFLAPSSTFYSHSTRLPLSAPTAPTGG
jgi:hypothetical protein